MKKTDRIQTKLRLVVRRETVAHLDREQLARVAGGSILSKCQPCHLPIVTDSIPDPTTDSPP